MVNRLGVHIGHIVTTHVSEMWLIRTNEICWSDGPRQLAGEDIRYLAVR